jgi:hypothetical protein
MDDASKKKWIIGCGGCLVVVILVAILIAVGTVYLGGMGMNALKEASDGAVKDIFGSTYQPSADYTSIGIPFSKMSAKTDVKNMVLLIHKKTGMTVLAYDRKMGNMEAEAIHSGDPKQIDQYVKRSGDLLISYSARGGSSSRLNDIRFDGTHMTKAANGKSLSISDTVLEVTQHGELLYTSGVITLIPEDKGQLITLLTIGGKNLTFKDGDENFKPGQKELEEFTLDLVNESELDDRLNP